jgi:hypothetical protein
MEGRKQLIRDFHAGQNLDIFLISAVSAVLVIRLFLHLTGYPQIGGATLHVAHMLWGGLLMLVGIVVLLSYLGRRSRQIAAFIGGIGFGTFIDEVGKFVTQDNDYFYQPAVALIYVTFVLTYLAARSIHRDVAGDPEDFLVNALQEVEHVAVNDLDREERDRALLYLQRSDQNDPLVKALEEVFHRSDLVPTPHPHPLVRLKNSVTRRYFQVASRREFHKLVIGFFLVQLGLKFLQVASILIWPETPIDLTRVLPQAQQVVEGLRFVDWAQLASSGLSAVLVAIGIYRLRFSRLKAFQMFQRSIMVSIFITQVFMFYRDEWAALSVLAFNLLVLATLNMIIELESAHEAAGTQRQGLTA